jgi:hypothetical protein
MIIETKKNGNITEYIADKDFPDNKLDKVLNHKLKPSQINTIIKEDADVYTKEGKLLLRFRKDILKKENSDAFYENVIKFAENTTCNRGSASGSKNKNIFENPKIKSNILGYYDKLAPNQKIMFKNKGVPLPKITVRETRFLTDYPDKYKKLLPFIKEIDKYYEKYIPEPYKKQRRKANQTPFKISGTAFTTVTTNVNYQTAVHTDKGDDCEGFGNLAVIEHGKYTGGETCFPQYGICVDVRTCDILYMDVHQAHGNLPIELTSPDVKRLSIVCYLRKSIWDQTKGKTQKFKEHHNKTLKKLLNENHNLRILLDI